MSDVEGAGGDEHRDKKKKKSKDKDKDKKKHRTPEEKEARRARKAAKEAAASADVQGIISDANLDDASDDGMGTPGRVTEATKSPIKSKSPAAKPKAAWGDVEKGKKGGGSGPNDSGGYVKPARDDAKVHAQHINVFRQKMGVDVHIESEVLEPYDDDDILSQIYNECERKGIVITRVTKKSKHHAVIEDIAFSMADDLEAMGVSINNVRITCVADYGDASKEDRDANGPAYEAFPYWDTGPKELGELSVGIGLYFQSLLWGQRVMLGLFFLGFFTVMTYVKSGMLDEQQAGGELTGFAIPTLGSVAWAHENEFRLLWFVSNTTWDGDDRSVMMGISFLECMLAVTFMFLVGWLSTEQKQTIENIDVCNISLQDYAVKVDYMPRDADAKEIGTHFARFGKVNQVVIGTDIDGVLGLHRKRAAAERAAETAEQRLAKAEFFAAKKELPAEQVQKGTEKLREKAGKLREKVKTIEDTIEEEMSSGEHGRHTSAFVTYETETAKEKCVKLYKPNNLWAWYFRPKKLRFNGYRMWVHVAPEGSDVIWENLDIIGAKAWIRRALAWLAMIIVLCITCAAVVYTKSLQNSLPPAISCAAPKVDGSLVCDNIWTTTGVTGQASKDTLATLLEFSEQVDATECLVEEFIVRGKWTGNATTYEGATAPAALYDANAEWTGGFDSSTKQDECAAMACFDCICKEKVMDVAMMYVGLAEDDDGYKTLCGAYFEGKVLEAGVSAFTAATNIVLAILVRAFAGFERHHTKSGRESSVMIKLFLLLTINSAMIPLLVFADIPSLAFVPYLFEGPYPDFSVGWYQDVGQLISTTLLINGVVYPMSALSKGLTPKITRGCLAPFAATQRALNSLYEGVEFPLSERYAQLMQMVFTGMVFSSGMPCLLPVAALFCFIAYYEGKYTLLRASRMPPSYDETMAKIFWATMPLAATVKILISTWMFSYEYVPSYLADGAFDVATSPISSGSQFDFKARFDRTNAAICVLTIVCLLVAKILTFYRKGLRAFFARMFPNGLVEEEEEEEVSMTPELSIARSDGIMKGLTTFLIQENPEYNEIVPSSATKSCGGPNGAVPEWEAAFAEADREESEAEAERQRKANERASKSLFGASEVQAEAAGEMPDAMKKRLKKDKKGKSPGAERVPRRKNSQVAPLGGMDDEVVDFGDDDYYGRGRAVGEAFGGITGGGLSAAMAMQPEGDIEAGMDADEDAEERRRRRKERKREKKEREQRA